MIRLQLIWLLPLMLFAAEPIRIATYNVENLFDLKRSGSEYAEYIPNTPWQWNAHTYKKKLQNIARVIADMKPDVIGLQEIESDAALRDLQIAVKKAGWYMPHRAIADAKPTTVKTALLSRLAILAQTEVRVTQSLAYRNILEAKIDTGNGPIYVFVNHWKSKAGPESRRIVSAKALKQRLDRLGGAPYVVMGDLNSDVEEKRRFIRKRKHNDTNGITGINDVLGTMQQHEGVTRSGLGQCPECAYNLWYDLQGAQRWTHTYRGQKEALDHIIISPSLADGKGLEYLPNSFERFTPEYLFAGKDKPYRWQRSRGYPKHHTGRGFSDHLPIFALFGIR